MLANRPDDRSVPAVRLDGLKKAPPATTPVPPQGAKAKGPRQRNPWDALTERFFGNQDVPPLMGQDVPKNGVRDATRRTNAEIASATGTGTSQRLAEQVRAENARVFDLLDKYSERHSDAGQPDSSASSDSERKPLLRSQYGPRVDEEQVTSKTGKVLQKSRYADVWSAQDEAKAKATSEATGAAADATGAAEAQPVAEDVAAASGAEGPAEPIAE